MVGRLLERHKRRLEGGLPRMDDLGTGLDLPAGPFGGRLARRLRRPPARLFSRHDGVDVWALSQCVVR